MKKKRMLSLLLALVLCLAFVPTAPALAADSDFVIEDGKLVKYNGPGGDVVIPEGVTNIGSGAFEFRTSLTSITIPAGVTRIEAGAFNSCTGLTKLTIPESLTDIREYAFDGCTNLSEIYFGGTEEQWNSITVGVIRHWLSEYGAVMMSSTDTTANEAPIFKGVTIHYNSTGPETAPAVSVAYASTQAVQLDGQAITLPAYALKDENGNDTNYIRLRDLAALLNGTAAQFDVTWDGAVNIVTKHAYDNPNGTEGGAPFTGNQDYTEFEGTTKVNGAEADLTAFTITYENGGHTYYKLRDLGQALDFNVGWSGDRGIFLETDKPYDPNN